VKQSSIKAALYLALTFSAGAAVGVFGQRLYSGNSVSAAARTKRSDEYRRAYLQEMVARLGLDSDQKQRLTSILDQTESQFKQLNEKHRPEYRAIHEAQVEQINSILQPTQRGEYSKLRAEREDRKKKRDAGQY
jgi:Spy/CpxP family protein refolding chaperone